MQAQWVSLTTTALQRVVASQSMPVWTLNVEDRAALAARIASCGKELVVAWLAANDHVTAQPRVLTAVVRPPRPQERDVDIVTDRIILHSASVPATEAAAQIADRTLKGPLSLPFELVGDHSPQPYWLSSDTTGFGFGYSPPWPQYYVSWQLDGVLETAQRLNFWEPISTAELAFDQLRDAVAVHLYGMSLQPMLLNSIEPSLTVRIPYPVRLSNVYEHLSRLVVEIERGLRWSGGGSFASCGHSRNRIGPNLSSDRVFSRPCWVARDPTCGADRKGRHSTEESGLSRARS